MNDQSDQGSEGLPDDVDPALSFYSQHCGGNDYLFDSHWHTHPGRMSAYCPHDPVHRGYRISVYELPRDLPDATRYWVRGFMAGNLPAPPEEYLDWDDKKFMEKWRPLAIQFVETGYWPNDELLRDYMEDRVELPGFRAKGQE